MICNSVTFKFNSFAAVVTVPLASIYASKKTDRIAHRVTALLVLSLPPGQTVPGR